MARISLFKHHRFPRDIILCAVRWYLRYPLPYQDVVDLLAERGITADRSTVYRWVQKSGPERTKRTEKHLRRASVDWHVDETYIRVGGKWRYLWRAIDANGQMVDFRLTAKRAIDAEGNILDTLVQPQRNAKAARRFFQRLVDRFGVPRVVITDKLRSYIKPIKSLAPSADHRAHKGLNNRIEGSHRPTRKREKLMGRFKSLRQAQKFLADHDQINVIFRPRRYRLSAKSYHHAGTDAFFHPWNDYTTEMAA